MIAALLPLFAGIPLVVAGALIAIGDRSRVHLLALYSVVGASFLASLALVVLLRDGSALAHGVGQWPLGIAIPFAADMFSALMLAVTGLLTLACAAFAHLTGRGYGVFFAPLVLVLMAGVNGALLTADLFNLFVFIEVMLLPSYGLYVLGAPRRAPMRRVSGARLYVTLNMLTSTIFLAGVGFIYGTIGTVNLGELQGAAAEDPAVAIAASIALLALGIKAAVVPVHGWLARAYPSTSPAVTALFSGLHTKVAIYAIYRIYAVLFEGDARFLWIGVLICTATMLLGVLGAVGENHSRSILAFHMVSQIGYILMGVALFTFAGLAAGIFYLVHHMIVKASLFLSTGAVEERYGSGSLVGIGVLKREPLIAVSFFIAALSLAGVPPFSGFVAKLALIIASLEAGQVLAAAMMVVVSLLTVFSMLKIWAGMFWSTPVKPGATLEPEAAMYAAQPGLMEEWSVMGRENEDALARGRHGSHAVYSGTRSRISLALAMPSLVLTAVTLALGLGATTLMSVSEVAAEGLLDTSTYIEAVQGS